MYKSREGLNRFVDLRFYPVGGFIQLEVPDGWSLTMLNSIMDTRQFKAVEAL